MPLDVPVLLPPDQIGGGVVRQRFTSVGRQLTVGDRLTREEVLAIPRANRDALVRNSQLLLVPTHPENAAAAAGRPTERFMLSLGGGKYGVIEGWKLTADPVSKAEAEALLAGRDTQAEAA